MNTYVVVVHNQPTTGGEYQPSPRYYVAEIRQTGEAFVIASCPGSASAQRIVDALNATQRAELAAV